MSAPTPDEAPVQREAMTLTAVVFTYNYGHFLGKLLDTIFAQTRRPDRIVVSDDCSPNDSEEDLRALCARYEGVTFIRNPVNLGNVAHYRARLSEVETDAYLLLSADDYLVDPNFFARALEVMTDHPEIIAAYGHHRAVDKDGNVLGKVVPATDRSWTRFAGPELRRELALANPVPAVCTVIRTALHERVPPFPLGHGHACDWQQWYVFTYYGDFARLELIGADYRIHGDNMSVAYEGGSDYADQMRAAYAQVMDWPDVTDEDRARLEVGLARRVLHAAPLRHLPEELAAHARQPGIAPIAGEVLLTRVARVADRLAAKLRQRSFDAE